MKLLEQFYKYTSLQGIDKKDIYEKSAEDFTVVSFPEEGEKDCVYNIVLVFYDNDDDVEIYVRKYIKEFDELDFLRKINSLNCEYTAVTFLIDENMLTLKSHLLANNEIEKVLREMVSDMQLAQKEFPAIK